jgi:hypothetical protein
MRRADDLRCCAIALAAVLFSGESLVGQDLEPVPTFAPGGNAVLLPVQSVRPLPSGAYPAGARSQREAREALTAEFSFAFEEAEEGAGTWKLPADVIRVMGRNPTLHVDPLHLAYQGLISKPKDLKRYQVYEPLHGQLRAISAMFDTRHMVLPLQVTYEPYDPEAVLDGTERCAAIPLRSTLRRCSPRWPRDWRIGSFSSERLIREGLCASSVDSPRGGDLHPRLHR